MKKIFNVKGVITLIGPLIIVMIFGIAQGIISLAVSYGAYYFLKNKFKNNISIVISVFVFLVVWYLTQTIIINIFGKNPYY